MLYKYFSDYKKCLAASGTCTCKSCLKVAKQPNAVDHKVCIFAIHLHKQAGRFVAFGYKVYYLFTIENCYCPK